MQSRLNVVWAFARPWELLCLAVFVVLTGWQLFVYPITGLSDNNDFPKVLGPAHVCKDPSENVNTWFVTGYAAGPQCAWSSGFTSSEILFVNVARLVSRPFTGRYYFDIRVSAAIHLLVLAAAMGLFLAVTRGQRPLVRFLLPPLAIFMFTDVAYVAYLNSAFMDNASWVLFLLLVTIAALCCKRLCRLWGAMRRPQPAHPPAQARAESSAQPSAQPSAQSRAQTPAHHWTAAAYAITGLLLVFSKAQHAVLGIPFAGLAAYFAWRDRESAARKAWAIVGLLLLVATAVMPALTPSDYQSISLYNLIFDRLAPADRTVLQQLGLDAGYEKWIGIKPFTLADPLNDPDWARAFLAHTSFADVALLYLRHPGIAVREIDHELHDSVHSMRPDYMANYRQADGFAPHTVATRFSLWSSLRVRALTNYPYFLVVLYALPLLGLIRPKSPFLPLALTLAAAGISEFAVCTLADAIDTHRHLFLFHVITDCLILVIVGAVAQKLSSRPELP